jgi:hypothetical protein
MVIVGKDRMLLIDSVSNPILRLEQAGLDFNFREREHPHGHCGERSHAVDRLC